MTSDQWAAIELMHEVADEVACETDQRLLHRLWISMVNSRPLPANFKVFVSGLHGRGFARRHHAQSVVFLHLVAPVSPSVRNCDDSVFGFSAFG